MTNKVNHGKGSKGIRNGQREQNHATIRNDGENRRLIRACATVCIKVDGMTPDKSPANTVSEDPRERRQAPRTPLEDITVFVREYYLEFPVKDLSISGIGFPHMYWPMQLCDNLTLDVLYKGEPLMEGLGARVVRMDQAVAGCSFTEMTEEQKEVIVRWVNTMLEQKG